MEGDDFFFLVIFSSPNSYPFTTKSWEYKPYKSDFSVCFSHLLHFIGIIFNYVSSCWWMLRPVQHLGEVDLYIPPCTWRKYSNTDFFMKRPGPPPRPSAIFPLILAPGSLISHFLKLHFLPSSKKEYFHIRYMKTIKKIWTNVLKSYGRFKKLRIRFLFIFLSYFPQAHCGLLGNVLLSAVYSVGYLILVCVVASDGSCFAHTCFFLSFILLRKAWTFRFLLENPAHCKGSLEVLGLPLVGF